jgi:hypothetical protein
MRSLSSGYTRRLKFCFIQYIHQVTVHTKMDFRNDVTGSAIHTSTDAMQLNKSSDSQQPSWKKRTNSQEKSKRYGNVATWTDMSMFTLTTWLVASRDATLSCSTNTHNGDDMTATIKRQLDVRTTRKTAVVNRWQIGDEFYNHNNINVNTMAVHNSTALHSVGKSLVMTMLRLSP